MVKNISIQVVAFFIIFQLISWVRELSLLESDTQAPDFVLQQSSGETISLDQFEGKPTVVFFWAPWCSVCKVSMPNLESFHQDNKDDINVVSVVLDYEDKDSVRQFIKSKQLTFPTLYGNNRVAMDYQIQGFPTYYVLDKDGKVHAKSMGYSSEIGIIARTLTL